MVPRTVRAWMFVSLSLRGKNSFYENLAWFCSVDDKKDHCKKLPMPGFQPGLAGEYHISYPTRLHGMCVGVQMVENAWGTGIDTSALLSQKNTLCRVAVIVQLGERFYSIHGYGTIFESSINSVGRVLVLWAKSHGFDPRMEHQF